MLSRAGVIPAQLIFIALYLKEVFQTHSHYQNIFLEHQIIFDLILSSPSERTQATLDLIFTEKDFLSKIKFQEAIYHAEMSTLLELIKDQNNLKKNILVIGHNPGLHLLIEHLTKTLIEKFPTCGFVKLSNFDSWKDLDANILDLKFFVTPRDLIHD